MEGKPSTLKVVHIIFVRLLCYVLEVACRLTTCSKEELFTLRDVTCNIETRFSCFANRRFYLLHKCFLASVDHSNIVRTSFHRHTRVAIFSTTTNCKESIKLLNCHCSNLEGFSVTRQTPDLLTVLRKLLQKINDVICDFSDLSRIN